MTKHVCAYCRHHLTGDADRDKILTDDKYYTCHRHQPAQFKGNDTCNYFEEKRGNR